MRYTIKDIKRDDAMRHIHKMILGCECEFDIRMFDVGESLYFKVFTEDEIHREIVTSRIESITEYDNKLIVQTRNTKYTFEKV